MVTADSVRVSFLFTLCRCVVFGRHSCDIGGILVGVCVMAWRIASVGSLWQGQARVSGDVCMDGTFLDVGISFRQ